MTGPDPLMTAARSPLRTERDILATLDRGLYTLDELYAEICTTADVARDRGLEPPDAEHPTDRRWRRRARSALQDLKARGLAERVGRSLWLLHDPPDEQRARRLLFVPLTGTPAEIEVRLQAACDLLEDLDEPADLVLCDPPYGLEVAADGHNGPQRRTYVRDRARVVGGYQDVPADEYREFTAQWIALAARALRPGGQLAVITGPQKAAIHQICAEDAGLNWVASIVAQRAFALRTTRRPTPSSHWVITVMVNGPLEDHRRVFRIPAGLPRARSGAAYPRSVWPTEFCGRADRHGVMKYANSLPLKLVRELVQMLTDPAATVIDPFCGSGTTAIACWQTARRCITGDVNPAAVDFAAARLLAEHAWPQDTTPTLPWPASTAARTPRTVTSNTTGILGDAGQITPANHNPGVLA